MLQCGRYRLLLDTVDEGVLVTVMHDQSGFICTVEGRDTRTAVLAALDAAEAHSSGEEPDPPVDEDTPHN
jgi:hypothetical protein